MQGKPLSPNLEDDYSALLGTTYHDTRINSGLVLCDVRNSSVMGGDAEQKWNNDTLPEWSEVVKSFTPECGGFFRHTRG